MKITIFGTGYVGLVTGACLSQVGHDVTCVDIDSDKVERLNKGIVDIHEPGLTEIVLEGIERDTLHFTCDEYESVQDVDAIFIAVGTPDNGDGSTNMTYVNNVAESIGNNLTKSTVIITKSTVPPGSCERTKAIINAKLTELGKDFQVLAVSNPEFLKEGSAVNDFNKPDRIIIGSYYQKALEVVREIYAPYNRKNNRIIEMLPESAELTKYAGNAMLATKISFINQIAEFAEEIGADIEEVRRGIGSDSRIGYDFIYPGCGYGGSCFPKDVKSLISYAKEHDIDASLLSAVDAYNERQKTILFEECLWSNQRDLSGKKIAVWGLSFKPNTNDIREAPSIVTVNLLVEAGAEVTCYDPVANDEFQKLYDDVPNVTIVTNKYDALKNASGLIIHTEWKEFHSPDFLRMKKLMKNAYIFDGRNIFENIEDVTKHGFCYYGIGR